MRQTSTTSATTFATTGATGVVLRPSLRHLARDTLARQRRDKELATRATRLRQAIDACCDSRGDSEANRTALQAECAALPTPQQADLLAHFLREAERWTL